MNSNDKYYENRKHRISKAEKFNEWMLEINSIHFSDNKAMTEAYDKITNEKI